MFIVSTDRDNPLYFVVATGATPDAMCPDFRTNTIRVLALPYAAFVDLVMSPVNFFVFLVFWISGPF